MGGEIERSVALSRAVPKRDTEANAAHMPSSARGFNLMDSSDTFWKNGYCPYETSVTNGQYVIERIDSGATFYKNHFYGQGKLFFTILTHCSKCPLNSVLNGPKMPSK